MHGRTYLNGWTILALAIAAFTMMNSPASAGDEWDGQDAAPAAHDYMLDKQDTNECSMVRMSDDELSEVTAAGFSSFTLEDGVARAYLNIEAKTFAEIDSLKMGYYNDGWDEDWTNVSLGSSTEDLTCKGIYIEAGFSNIDSPSGRTLNYLRVGTPEMTGPITADFNSFSGRIEDGSGNALVVNVGGTDITLDGSRITGLGTQTVYSQGEEFYLQLSNTVDLKGWWFFWEKATIE